MPFVLLFWWSCPLCCVSFPLGAVVGNGPLMLATAIGVCLLGCFSFFWWLSVGALGGFCPPGVFVFFPRVVALAFVLWRLSCGVCLFVLWGFCFLLSNCPLQLLLMVCGAFCASGLLLLLPLLLLLLLPLFLLPLLLFFSSFFLFFLFLAFFFFGCLCSLWSPSCFPCLALPGVWPSLVLGLVGPSWHLLVVVLVLSSIVWGSWRWWPCWRWWWWWSAFARL